MYHGTKKDTDGHRTPAPQAKMTKLVRLTGAAEDLVGSNIYRFTSAVEHPGDRFSIWAHPSCVMYQENYLDALSSSPFRLQFRYIGTSSETGETCYKFNHYKNVQFVEYTNTFTSVAAVFQITSQLKNAKEMQIYLTPDNVALSEYEKHLQNLKSVYNCPSVELLVISIAKWNDTLVSAPLNYETSKLAVIADYIKRCCPNLNVIRIYTDEENKTTKCWEILFKFNEELQRDFFPKTMVLFGPFKNKKPVERDVEGRKDRCSSGSTIAIGDDETTISRVKTLQETEVNAKSGLSIEAEDAVRRYLLSTDNDAGMTMQQNPMQGLTVQTTTSVQTVEGSSGALQMQQANCNPLISASSHASATVSGDGFSSTPLQVQHVGKNDWEDDDSMSDFADVIDHHNRSDSHPEILPAEPPRKFLKSKSHTPDSSCSPVGRVGRRSSFSANVMRFPSRGGGAGYRHFRGNRPPNRNYNFRGRSTYSNDRDRHDPYHNRRMEWSGHSKKDYQVSRRNESPSGGQSRSRSRSSARKFDGTHETREPKMPHSSSPDRTSRAKTSHHNRRDSAKD